jgi:hypothetical protein
MFVWGMFRVADTGVPSRWHPPQRRGTPMVEVGERGSVFENVMSPVALFARRGQRVTPLRGKPMQAYVVLALLVGVARSTLDAGQFLGMWHLLACQVRVTSAAFKLAVRRGLESHGVEGRWHSHFTLARPPPGLVASLALLGAGQRLLLLRGSSGGPQGGCRQRKERTAF